MVSGDRSGLALHDDYRKLLTTAVRECGFKSLRQHGIFHDDMYVWFEKNKPFSFQYVFSPVGLLFSYGRHFQTESLL